MPTEGSKRSKTSRFPCFSVGIGGLGPPEGLLRRKWPPRIVQEARSRRLPGYCDPEIDENMAKGCSGGELAERQPVAVEINDFDLANAMGGHLRTLLDHRAPSLEIGVESVQVVDYK